MMVNIETEDGIESTRAVLICDTLHTLMRSHLVHTLDNCVNIVHLNLSQGAGAEGSGRTKLKPYIR